MQVETLSTEQLSEFLHYYSGWVICEWMVPRRGRKRGIERGEFYTNKSQRKTIIVHECGKRLYASLLFSVTFSTTFVKEETGISL